MDNIKLYPIFCILVSGLFSHCLTLESLLWEHKAYCLIGFDFFSLARMTAGKCLEVNLSGEGLILSFPSLWKTAHKDFLKLVLKQIFF